MMLTEKYQIKELDEQIDKIILKQKVGIHVPKSIILRIQEAKFDKEIQKL